MKKALLPILLLFSLLLSASASAYIFSYTMQDDKTSNHYANAPSVFYKGTCTLNFTLYATAGSASYPFTLNPFWYSPDMQQVLFSPALNYYNNITCQKLQSIDAVGTKNSTTNMYESRTKILTSASTTNSWIKSTLDCDPDINNIIFYNNTNPPLNPQLDSYGNFPYAYGKKFGTICAITLSPPSGNITDAINWIKNGYYGATCPDSPSYDLKVDKYDSDTCGFLTGARHGVRRFVTIPFNSQAGGLVNFSVNPANWTLEKGGGSSCFSMGTVTTTVYLWNTVTDTYINYGTIAGAGGAPITQNLQLNRNTDYWLIIEQLVDGGTGVFGDTCTDVYNGNPYNISIWAYEPNLQCTSWGNCTNGYQYRQCTDLNDILEPYVEQQICGGGLFPEQSIFMGFDSGYAQNTFYCNQGYYNIFTSLCARDPVLKTRYVPNGWYRNGYYQTDNISAGGTNYTGWIQDYVDIDLTDYYAPDSSSSEGALKIWFIPRKTFLPVYNFSTGRVWCQGTEEGQVGGTWTYVNNTFWVSRNITTLSPYMTFSYRAKKCSGTPSATPIQTAAFLGCTLVCELAGNCANSGLCSNATAPPGLSQSFFGDDYYTGTGCPSDPPPSYLAVRIRDLTINSTDIQNYQKQITEVNWETGYQEDNINNMSLNHTYEVSFSAYPQTSITQTESNCILIDDVNINFRSQPAPCSSGCAKDIFGTDDYDGDGINDYTYIESTRLSETSCQIRVLPLDARCTPANITQNIIDMKNGVRNYTCDGTTMITWNSATETATFTPNSPTCVAQSGTGNPLNPATGDAIVNSFVNIFTIPAVLALLLSVLISGLITAKVSKVTGGGLGGSGHGGGVIFIVCFIAFITAFTAANLFPLWLYIVLIVIAGGIAAKVIGFI